MNFDDALSQLLVFALPLTRMSPPFQPMVISTTTYTKGFAEHFNWVIRFHRLYPFEALPGFSQTIPSVFFSTSRC